jgi:threonine dehydrogenase-like Zn-dependent dehydrogenase
VENLVTGRVSLEQVPDMFALLGEPNEHCKVMIIPNS